MPGITMGKSRVKNPQFHRRDLHFIPTHCRVISAVASVVAHKGGVASL